MKPILRGLALWLALLLFLSASALAAGYTTLQRGSSGTEVIKLQSALKTLGYLSSAADGIFGAATENAVKAFQKANKLTQDGKAGTKTQTLIYAQLAQSSSSSAVQTLRSGSSGSEVITLQTQLKALGYYSGTIDGKYGSGTAAAVKAFQKANGLTRDGVAGIKTRAAIQAKYDALTQTEEESSTPVVTSSGTLYLGCTGEKVTALQTKLRALGYLSSAADGIFGAATQKAVKAFQQANGLTADGLAGTKTLKLIDSKYNALGSGESTGTTGTTETAGTSASGTLSRTLRRNSTGEDVKMVQTRLKELGYFSGTIDGVYGSATIASVQAFQQANDLSADGICGVLTWKVMSSSSAVKCSSSAGSSSTTVKGPDGAKVQLLHWFNSVKPTLSNGNTLLVYDPATGISWNLRVFSCGRHCDAEPWTAEDTAQMNQAFGNVTTWTPKPVYVKLPDGRWSLASTHNTPHESQSIKTNNFNGHLCVHFLRDMSEAMKNDPNYGVQNQNAIRKKWKELTGETIQ